MCGRGRDRRGSCSGRPGAVEQASEHPVAAAISEAARPSWGHCRRPAGSWPCPAWAPAAPCDGHDVLVGRAGLLTDLGMDHPAGLAACAPRRRQAIPWCSLAGAAACAARSRSRTRSSQSAAEAVAELRRLGLRTVLLTGDSQATARAVGAQVGTDEVIAGALPDDKVAVLGELQARGHRVAMVGDGINDAPALAAANLGIALGTGTDVAISAADLIVLRDDLGAVPDAIRLSRRTLGVIRGNLAWAFGYNIAAIPLAAARLPQPADRRRGDGPVLGVRRRQQRAAAPLRTAHAAVSGGSEPAPAPVPAAAGEPTGTPTQVA